MVWDIDPEIVRLGPIGIRYYSLMFVIGFLSMEYYVKGLFKGHGKDPQLVSSLTMHIFVGTFVGARLGHCLFYAPEFYLSNPLEILKVWEGGLASHGGYIGVITAVFIYLKKNPKIKFLWLMDIVAGPALFVGFLIRLGNFFNSEIVGKITDVPWAIIFQRVDPYPRHPAQLYEAFGYLTIALIFMWQNKRKTESTPDGLVFANGLIAPWIFRFIIEFTKDNQSSLSKGAMINMGQMLSVLYLFFGFGLIYYLLKKKAKN